MHCNGGSSRWSEPLAMQTPRKGEKCTSSFRREFASPIKRKTGVSRPLRPLHSKRWRLLSFYGPTFSVIPVLDYPLHTLYSSGHFLLGHRQKKHATYCMQRPLESTLVMLATFFFFLPTYCSKTVLQLPPREQRVFYVLCAG